MCSCSFGEDEADIAVLDFLLSLDESSYGIAVTLYEDTSSYSYDKSSESSVIRSKIGTYKCAHILELPLGQVFADKNAVSKALMVGCDYIRVLLREILPSHTAHPGKDSAKKKESVLCYNSHCTSSRRGFVKR